MLWMYDFTPRGFKSQVQMVQKEPLLYSLKSFAPERAIGDSKFSSNGVNATRQIVQFTNEEMIGGVKDT